MPKKSCLTVAIEWIPSEDSCLLFPYGMCSDLKLVDDSNNSDTTNLRYNFLWLLWDKNDAWQRGQTTSFLSSSQNPQRHTLTEYQPGTKALMFRLNKIMTKSVDWRPTLSGCDDYKLCDFEKVTKPICDCVTGLYLSQTTVKMEESSCVPCSASLAHASAP